jgi:hypothetical protein
MVSYVEQSFGETYCVHLHRNWNLKFHVQGFCSLSSTAIGLTSRVRFGIDVMEQAVL